MNPCFTGLTTGLGPSLWGVIGSVSAGSIGDTKNSPWCSLERLIQKAKSKKFVNLLGAGSHVYPKPPERVACAFLRLHSTVRIDRSDLRRSDRRP